MNADAEGPWWKWTVEQLLVVLGPVVPPSELKGRRKGALVDLAIAHMGEIPPSKDQATRDEIDAIEHDEKTRERVHMGAQEAADAVRARMPELEGPEATNAAMTAWRDAEPESQQSLLPTLSDFQMMEHMAARLSRSPLMPSYIHNKPDNALVILLIAYDLKISANLAITEIQVFPNGRNAKSAYLMRFLIRREGHKLWPTVDYDAQGRAVAATWHCIRNDDPTNIHDVRFTIQDAIKAHLCTVDEDGNPVARSGDGKPLSWELYTEDMLLARATSRLARRHFEDVVGGAAYTPEELGFIDAEGEEGTLRASAGPAPAAQPMDAVQIQAFRDRLDALTDELRADVKAVWRARRFPTIDALLASHYGPIDAIITAREKKMPDDADVIGENPEPHIDGEPHVDGEGPCPECGQTTEHAEGCSRPPF